MSEEEFIKKYKEKDLTYLKDFKKKAIRRFPLFFICYSVIMFLVGTMQIAFAKGLGTVIYLYIPVYLIVAIIVIIHSALKGFIINRWKDAPDNKNE